MDVLIHIGSAKTGSSTVQRLLARNADLLLRKHGIATVVNDSTLLDCAKGLPATLSLPPGCSRLIYSDERLLSRIASRQEAARVVDMLARRADRVSILCYVRRQDEFVVSSYVTRLLAGETRKFGRLPRRPGLDVRHQLAYWEAAAGQANIKLRRYGGDYLVNGSIIDDFAEAAGLDLPELRHRHNANVSPTTDILELQRRLNLRLGSAPQRRFILKSLLQVQGRGPRLGMSRADRQAIDGLARGGEDALARLYLGQPRLFTHDFPDDEAPQPMLTGDDLTRIVRDFGGLHGTAIAHPGPMAHRAAMGWATEALLGVADRKGHVHAAEPARLLRGGIWRQASPAFRSSLAGLMRRLPWTTLALALCQSSDFLELVGSFC